MTGLRPLGGEPMAHEAAVIQGERFRVTVLTEALIRMEWSKSGVFEDRASTFAVQRALPVPEFQVRRPGGRLELWTDSLHVDYDGGPFSPSGLAVTVRGEVAGPHTRVWRYGEPGGGLGGTARTLDGADGAVPLGGGVVSASGLAVIDDSASFVFEADGTPAARRPGTQDLYIFAHGRDYLGAVRDLYAVSGSVPLLPRWALGNWWSKYHPYTADEYLQLMDRFAAEDLPFSVAVLDMDWHYVDIDPRFGKGWTGYSWNRNLFPDPAGFLRELHGRGLHVTLNVHPADGIRAFEDAYPRVAQAMGIDPATEQPVVFDPTDPKFMDVYFRLLHHPLEDEGVDFWWLDWQQGSHTRIPGVDPLWLLNIAHFLDSGRGDRRAITFSRYAGPGSHRYPVGFSGDTVISWASLDFQPYFTSTASNIGYGWWSHDIGGHWYGGRDDVLVVRWVEFGVFSPIMRLHSTLHPFIRKEPWSYSVEARAAISAQLRLRHRLVPYLHTMNARSAHEGLPLIEPMYWRDPAAKEAYRVPNEYRFGTELIVAPITTPQNRDLLLGSTRAWLPAGHWTDIFTGVTYEGGREVRLHRTLESIPVLLRAGGILPLAGGPGEKPVWAGENPVRLEILLAPGADGRFDLKEEDGTGDGRDPSRWATTRIRYAADEMTLTIGAAQGNTGCIPAERDWTVTAVGAGAGSKAVAADGREFPATSTGTAISFAIGRIRSDSEVTIRFDSLVPRTWSRLVEEVYALVDRAQINYETKQVAYEAVRDSRSAPEAAARVQGLELSRDLESALLELILAEYGLQG